MMRSTVRAFLLFFIFLSARPFTTPAALSTRTSIPEFQDIRNWIENDEPITRQSLEGSVVLVVFFNATLSQCLWEMNILSEWHSVYSSSAPFKVIGIAVPELKFEHDITNVESSIKKLQLQFPVGIDAKQSLKNAYGVRSIPAYFIIDSKGAIRHQYSGRIPYPEVEKKIRLLLAETPSRSVLSLSEPTVIPTFPGHEDLLLGYKKIRGLGNNQRIKAQTSQNFSYPTTLNPFFVYLNGKWTPYEENFTADTPTASLKMVFSSVRAGLVAGTSRKRTIPSEVKIDGRPLNKQEKGKDIIFQEGRSYFLIKGPRYYEIVNSKDKSSARTLEVTFEEPGAEIYKAGFN